MNQLLPGMVSSLTVFDDESSQVLARCKQPRRYEGTEPDIFPFRTDPWDLTSSAKVTSEACGVLTVPSIMTVFNPVRFE